MLNSLKEIVINLHLTEACNYSCKHCFAHWEKQDSLHATMHKLSNAKKVIDSLVTFFQDDIDNPIRKLCLWKDIRFNFVGGEVCMLKDFPQILAYAKEAGAKTSIVTNGHYLDKPMINLLASSCDMIGFSIDSLDPELNMKIGRFDRKSGKMITKEDWINIINNCREINPLLEIKINTVVNQYNHNSNLIDFIKLAEPYKWKIFRVLPVHTDTVEIADDEFFSFIERHKILKHLIALEDNQDMQLSYIMVDPLSRFFQTFNLREGHIFSSPIITSGAKRAFSEIPFDLSVYDKRYKMYGNLFDSATSIEAN